MTAIERPSRKEIDHTHRRLVAALNVALTLAGRPGAPDFSDLLAGALQELARRRGGAEALVESRPGSWEAVHVRALGATELDWGL
jgi:hypothetical protein